MEEKQKNVVVIGGGTGTFTVLSGLKKYPHLSLTAIVTMADSGGSTGRLRDEFGYLPVSDVRMALVALADDELSDHERLRQLFLYRFEKGGRDLVGHNFGNLFLVALTDILGSETEAIQFASRMLRTKGVVHPVTTDNVTLVATYDDGVVVHGETHIDEPKPGRDSHKITELRTEPEGAITPDAAAALAQANLIVIGPGDLYTSILAVCVIGGVREALMQSPAKIVYISNLMTKYGQTTSMSTEDHVAELAQYIGRRPDVVLSNSAMLPDALLARYAEEGEYPVKVVPDESIYTKDLLASSEVVKSKSDRLRRSLIRHDPDKLAAAIVSLI